jgi:iron(III) transport system substrate-binding protein
MRVPNPTASFPHGEGGMSRSLLSMALGAGLLALGACGPSAQPVGTTAADAPAAAPSEWERLLAAAKQEGKVAVIGPTGTEPRDALTQPFTDKYGISVEYFGASNRDLVPRVRAEREAGQYAWDVRVGGAIVDALKPMGALEPLEPALLLPEVTDRNNWRGGEPSFSDYDRLILAMTPFQRGILFVNPNLVRVEDLKSYKDLLDPRWKGRIIMDDPRSTGPSEQSFTFFYLHPELGPEFIRALGRQEPLLMKDYQQEVDAIGQGRYPILVGGADFIAEPRMKQGIPLVIVDPRQLREGGDVGPANGEVALFNRAPHPNAAKVYLNWLLSREGQTTFARGVGYVSSRVDVPTDHVLPWRIPEPGSIRTYTEEQQAVKREQVLPLLYEVFGR